MPLSTISSYTGVRNYDYWSWTGGATTATDPAAGIGALTLTQIYTSGGIGKWRRLAFTANSTTATIYTPVLPLCRPGTDTFTGLRARVRLYSTGWSTNAGSSPNMQLKIYNSGTTTVTALNGAVFTYQASGMQSQIKDNSGTNTNSASNVALSAGWHLFEIVVDAAGTVYMYIDGTQSHSSSVGAINWTGNTGTYNAQASGIGITNMSNTYEAAAADLYYGFL